MGQHHRRGATLVGLLLAVVLVAYGSSLAGDFVWDDRPLIVQNRLVKSLPGVLELLTSSFWETGDRHDRFRAFFRPLVGLTYALDHTFWGLSPLGYRITNLLVHLFCVLLVFGLARAGGLQERGALAAAALFAAHPVHVESVAWISGRTDLLCTMFVLAAFLIWRRRPSGAAWPGCAPLVLFAAALFSKEMAATLPLLIFTHRLCVSRDRLAPLRSAVAAASPFAAILVLYLVARAAALGTSGTPLYTPEALPLLATILFVLARYLTLLLLPVGLDAHYPYDLRETLLDPVVAISAAMLALAGWGAWRLRHSRGEGFFLCLWIPLTLLPILFTFGRFGDVIMADRFLYLPSVGLSLLAGIAFENLWSRAGERLRPALIAGGLSLTLLLSLASGSRSRIWTGDRVLFTDMLKTSPDSALVRANLGLAYYSEGRLEEAMAEARRAIDLSPGYSLAHNNLAAALESRGRLQEALLHYQEALKYAPGRFEPLVNSGHLLARLGRREQGLRMLEGVVRDHPRSAEALFALAHARSLGGENERALALLERARLEDPDLARVHYLMGRIHDQAGRSGEAARCMRRFLALWPEADDEHARAARGILAAASSVSAAGTPRP